MSNDDEAQHERYRVRAPRRREGARAHCCGAVPHWRPSRRAARALVQATAEEWIRAGEALDMHRRMHDLANEVENMGHPAHADRLRALADDLLKETRR